MKYEYGALAEWSWQGQTKALPRKTRPSTALATTYPTQTSLGSYQGLHSKKRKINHLSHGTAPLTSNLTPLCGP
jgi:hypothetical protein